ncbi:MAG TPA: acyltransferase [Phycisphaerae bacterium]|nr:acyltransferase [Phycisphaerae bacterium]
MLDILRVCAVQLVFGRHLMPLTNDGPRVVLRFAHTVGRAAAGMDILFVLSGFLVASILFRDFQRSGRLHVGRFLLRRGFKIYPAYVVYLFASIPLAKLLGQSPPTTGQLTAHLLFFQNYYPHFLEHWVHLWSLAVEEHFYIGIAGALLLARWVGRESANPFRWIPGAFLGSALICLTWRCILAASQPFEFYRNFPPTHLRMDTLLFGVAVAYCFHFHRERAERIAARFRTWLWLGGVAGLMPAFCVGLANPFTFTFGFTLYYLATGALIAATMVTPMDPSSLLARAATFLATRSYSIYLWHMLAFLAVRQYFISYEPQLGKIWLLNTVTSIVVAVVIGSVMAILVELPILRLRDRWVPGDKALSTSPPPVEELPAEPAETRLQTIE